MDYNIRGMTCSACANVVAKTVNSYLKTQDASVNYATEVLSTPMTLSSDDILKLNNDLSSLGYQIQRNNEIFENQKNNWELPLTLAWIVLSGLIFLIEMGPLHHYFPRDISWKIQFVLSTPIVFIGGKLYLKSIIPFITKGISNMNTLVGIGTLSAYLYSFFLTWFYDYAQKIKLGEMVYFEAGSFIVSFVLLGKYFEKRAKNKAKYEFQNLLNMSEKKVTVLRDEIEIQIKASDILLGEKIILRPGEQAVVDGEVISGESYLEESMITGEPLPRLKKKGDQIFSGTLNQDGRLIYHAQKIGHDTVLAGIALAVSRANLNKAPIQKLADKISSVFVPTVIVIALITLFTWIFVAKIGLGEALSFFIAVLVIACPCALGLATPTAVMIATSRASSFGLLMDGPQVIEKGDKLTTILFDKTGTLTYGIPSVIFFKNVGQYQDSEILSFAHTLEYFSEHPLAKAIIKFCEKQKNINELNLESFETVRGKGVRGEILYQGKKINIIIASGKWLRELGDELGIEIKTSFSENIPSGSKSYIVIDNEVQAIFVIGDKIKNEAPEVIKKLIERGITPWLVTGDNSEIAHEVGVILGIKNIRAEVLPADKLNLVTELKHKGEVVGMIGDGLNDAPALAQSDLSFAMSSGSDLSKNTADIVILGGNLKGILDLLNISRKSYTVIKQNLLASFFYNVVGIPWAAGVFIPLWGIAFPPMFAGLAMGLSSVTVVANSLRLLKLKQA